MRWVTSHIAIAQGLPQGTHRPYHLALYEEISRESLRVFRWALTMLLCIPSLQKWKLNISLNLQVSLMDSSR